MGDGETEGHGRGDRKNIRRNDRGDWEDTWGLIRELQPGAVISIMGPDVRWIGNEAGVKRESEWSVIPVAQTDDRPAEKNPGGIAGLDAMAPDLGPRKIIEGTAKKGGRLIWYPAQVDVSIRPGWFYHAAEDLKAKTLEQLLDIYYGAVGGNAQLLLNIPPDKRGRIHENDVLRLKQLGDVLKKTFSINLAAGAKANAAGKQDGRPGSGPEKTLDADLETSWMTDDGGTNAAIEYDFGQPRTFNVAMIQEDIRSGQRVESFSLDAWDGKKWKEMARGTTVGYKRLLRFPAIKVSRVRLRILSSRGSALISEFGLYFDPTHASTCSAIVPVPEEAPASRTSRSISVKP